MKICPKCGQEMVGDTCPKCTGPEIIVNNNEYLQRKKAYEEKQAREKESASSSSTETAEFDIPVDEVIEKLKISTVKLSKKVKGLEKKQDKEAEKKNTEKKNTENNGAEQKKTTTRKAPKKKWKWVILIGLVLLVGIGSAFGIYQLVHRKNYTLYMSYNGKIYDAASLDSTYVGELAEVIFAADKKTFYKVDWPEEMAGASVSESCVSQNGAYFAGSVYHEETKEHTIYVWNENGCYEIATNAYQKHIKTVTDDGQVIFTDTQMLNAEGYAGTTALYVCTTEIDSSQPEGQRLTGTTVQVDSDLRSAYVYSDGHRMICMNNSNRLYVYDYKQNRRTIVEEYANSLYIMSEDTAHLYTAQAAEDNLLEDADAFVYGVDGIFYYYDMDRRQTITIGKASGTNLHFIYDSKGARMYLIESGVVKAADITENRAGAFQEIDRLGNGHNMVYISEDNRIVYVNGAGNLCYISNGTSKLIRENVVDGSLSMVGNTTDSITYIVGDTQYYCEDITAKEVAMYGAGSKADTSDTYFYKNRLYFYNSEKELYSCTKKGTDDNKIGLVDSLWLGTEWK